MGLYKKKEPSWFIGIVTGIHILTSVLIALDNGWIVGLKCLFGVPLAFIMFILLTLLGVLGLYAIMLPFYFALYGVSAGAEKMWKNVKRLFRMK